MWRDERNSNDPGFAADPWGVFRWGVVICHGLAQTHHAYFRRVGTCGRNYFGLGAWVGWVGFGACVEASRPQTGHAVLLAVWAAMPVLFVLHRLVSSARHARGRTCHSMYLGDSVLGVVLPFAGADFCRGFAEPAVACTAGVLCLDWCPAFGWWLLLGGAANGLSLGLLELRDKRRLGQAEDAWIESRANAEQLRARLRE